MLKQNNVTNNNKTEITNSPNRIIECANGTEINSPASTQGPNEPPHDKTNKMACAPSEDSDQPGHPPSLIRVFAVRMKKAWVLSYPLSAQRGL